MQEVHRLSDVDYEAHTAVCSVCGPTQIRISRDGEKRRRQCKTVSKRVQGARTQTSARKRHRYSLTAAEMDALATDTCRICRRSNQPMHIDHDHSCCPGRKSCGRCVREMICRDCNFSLGRFNDDVETLMRAVAYLKKWKIMEKES